MRRQPIAAERARWAGGPYRAARSRRAGGHRSDIAVIVRRSRRGYRATARALGFQSMATAAALGFEGCQRTWDVFGFEDPDGRKHRGFLWSDYWPGVSISLRQSKTGNPVVLPLTIEAEGETIWTCPA